VVRELGALQKGRTLDVKKFTRIVRAGGRRTWRSMCSWIWVTPQPSFAHPTTAIPLYFMYYDFGHIHQTLRVKVPAPEVIHDVSVTALERWAGNPSTSPKAHLAKRLVRKP
jgi:hypothetical protein